ncbi:ROK family protein [Kineococcus rhizosphaerae]|uniref:Glucokinase n=1 Tax=Kineococcus rhizosphaerae TaxID=559628 RepID=A0A2T0R2B6_9ACTN|nr:ROK family protein [Kineococcus rhizosphaerae]PRY13921.1 glucokinase [Kineococcus rhizosphaerae]
MSVVLAVDVGGTGLKGAVVDARGREVAVRDRPTRSGGSAVEENLRELLAELAAAAPSRPVAVGIGTPGTVEEASGTVVYASNLGWRNLPLRSRLEETTGLPVAVGHDGRAAGRAEQLVSGTHGSFVFVPIGTGISAALVVAGSAVSGVSGAAGEFGHVVVHPDGEPCPCGQRGCVEAYAAGAAVLRRYRARGGTAASTVEVVQRLGADPVADEVWDDAVRALALGLQGLTMLLDPAEIVLGGGVSGAGPRLLDPLEARLRSLLAWREPPPLRTARWGARAGRIGAALLGFERVGIEPAFEF